MDYMSGKDDNGFSHVKGDEANLEIVSEKAGLYFISK
jgi:hypothetical protein